MGGAVDSQSILPIACAIDRSYVLPLLVMLESLQAHLRASYRPVLFLLHHHDLPAEDLALIEKIVDTHHIVPCEAVVDGLPAHRNFPREAAFPLLLADVLPTTLERVLFLDADVLVLDDVAKLWESDLAGHAIGAAPDGAIARCGSARGVKQRRRFGVPDEATYFNAGVMLIDLAAWRDRDVTRRALVYLRTVGEDADYFHQEALNATLWNDWRRLPSRWNVLASVVGRPHGAALNHDAIDPGIVHFAGRFKPWRIHVGGPFDAHYDAFLARVTPRVPAPNTTVRDALLSWYDRRLRSTLYGCERALWSWRLI